VQPSTTTITGAAGAVTGGQAITSLWNGVNTGTSGTVTIRNAPDNGTLAAGSPPGTGRSGAPEPTRR